jgi:hypothetical protein
MVTIVQGPYRSLSHVSMPSTNGECRCECTLTWKPNTANTSSVFTGREWAEPHLHRILPSRVSGLECQWTYIFLVQPLVLNITGGSLCSDLPFIDDNSTKLLSVKHTYIYCTSVLHGQHVSTYYKAIFRPYIQIQILG